MRLCVKVLVAFVFFLGSGSCVDDEKLKKLFEEYGFKVTGDVRLDIDLPYWGQPPLQVEAACGNLNRNTTNDLQYYSEGLKDAVNFLCKKDNLREYKSYAACFNNSEVGKVFGTCKNWREAAEESFDGSQVINSNLTLCSIEEVYQSCTSYVLQSLKSCNKNASKWFDTWWRKMNYYYHVSISCIDDSAPKEDSDSDEWSIVLGIILAVTACLLVIGIIVFVVFLFSRRKLSGGDDDPTHARGPRGFGQRREVPPPYALVVNSPRENAAEGDAGGAAITLRLVDRDNRMAAETEARLYDGSITNATGNGLILPPTYSSSLPPPDAFGNEAGIVEAQDSDKEDELLSLGTSTTRCSSVNLQAVGSVASLSSSSASKQGYDERLPDASRRDLVQHADQTLSGCRAGKDRESCSSFRSSGEPTAGCPSPGSTPGESRRSDRNVILDLNVGVEGQPSERTSSIV